MTKDAAWLGFATCGWSVLAAVGRRRDAAVASLGPTRRGRAAARIARRRAAAAALAAMLAVLALGSGATRAEAEAWDRIDALATGTQAPAPAGWLNRCMVDLPACAAVADAATVPADRASLELLEHVQRSVNAAIAPEREPAGRDLWVEAPARGDCEDYALTKQALLRRAGLPRNAVRLATARLPGGEDHAVLTVETTRGTLVLDNLMAGVVPMGRLPYRWLAVEAPSLGLRWQELEGGASPGLAAATGRPGGTAALLAAQ
jgi:predicted transglutaminase-like cysteine proteinase